MTFRLIADTRCQLGEGPVWLPEPGMLLSVDIKRSRVLRQGPQTVQDVVEVAHGITCLAATTGGGLIGAGRTGLLRAPRAEALDSWTPISPVEPDRPGNRPNDGKAGADGAFWFGTMDDAEQQMSGALYRWTPKTGAVHVRDGIGISNGLAWTPDGTRMLYTASMRSIIWAYAFDPETGAMSNQSVFATVPEADGYPDGLTIDARGHVFSAHWDGGRVREYAPDGRIIADHPVPVPRPTSCAFGGPDLGILYVTSARVGLTDEQLEQAPQSGAIFAADGLGTGQTPRRVRA